MFNNKQSFLLDNQVYKGSLGYRVIKLFQDENHAFLSLLGTVVSIRTEIEMQAIYEKYGDDVYSELGEIVSSYYSTFLRNYMDNEEEFAVFLMHNAHETMMNHEGENLRYGTGTEAACFMPEVFILEKDGYIYIPET